MQSAFVFLIDTLFSLLFWVFLLRLLLQWNRSSLRNPVVGAVMQLTNWLVLPLRRILPSIGRIDTASLVSVFAVALLQIGALRVAAGMDLRVNPQTQKQLAQINEAYKAIVAERLRVAAEAERQRILEEQKKLVAERTEALLKQAKARNFRVKEEVVNGKKRFTFVKMVIQ